MHLNIISKNYTGAAQTVVVVLVLLLLFLLSWMFSSNDGFCSEDLYPDLCLFHQHY